MHQCTEKDMARFHQPSRSSRGLVDKYKKLNGFMCLDWSKIEMQATPYKKNFKAMDIMLVPCGMRETLLGGTEDRIPEDCNYD